MTTRVERQYIDKWLDKNYPNAVAKLSIKSGVTANSIAKIRLGHVPKSRDVRKHLSEAVGVSVDELFPEKTGT